MTAGHESSQAPLVWIAGTGWDNVAGTDRRLVEELSQHRKILWVDPPVAISSPWKIAKTGRMLPGADKGVAAIELVGDSVLRLRVLAPPGITRPGIRSITALCLNRAVRSALATAGWTPGAVVVAFPLARFPAGVPGRRLLYVTDDWLSGASLMGFSRASIQRAMRSNVSKSHVVAAVSNPLMEELQAMIAAGRTRQPRLVQEFAVLPNGCPQPEVGTPPLRSNVAGLVGQLNERLDLDVLEAVQSAGVHIRVIGPRADRDPVFGRRLDAFLRRDKVEWMGSLPSAKIPKELSRIGAGLTPYTDSAFNRASFPLKTLEYLAAGVGVVATDSPAVRWLDTEHVAVASSTRDFVHAVLHTLNKRNDAGAEMDRRSFAGRHTWGARGSEFLRLAAAGPVTVHK